MKHYLENHKFYVINEDEKLVYKVGKFETYSNHEAIHICLELVAGWDYVNPDENDNQGWVPADRFVEDIQIDYINQYFLKEGMEEALEANGYTIMKDVSPALRKIIDNHEKMIELGREFNSMYDPIEN